ncbi:ORFL159W.iORF1 [Human betaherpesvirus 5]|nr:ORFL159W.iORF1 [Human betaherpesvirus 5]QHX40496.1 ORFL159W.iORF1 [Human betaherpesvirus 5]
MMRGGADGIFREMVFAGGCSVPCRRRGWTSLASELPWHGGGDPAPSVCLVVWLACVYSLLILVVLLLIYRCCIGFQDDLVSRTLAVYQACIQGPICNQTHNSTS